LGLKNLIFNFFTRMGEESKMLPTRLLLELVTGVVSMVLFMVSPVIYLVSATLPSVLDTTSGVSTMGKWIAPDTARGLSILSIIDTRVRTNVRGESNTKTPTSAYLGSMEGVVF
jgi:hypothetical protein